GTFAHYNTQNSPLTSDTLVFTLLYDQSGNLWTLDAVNYHHNIFRFDGNNWQLIEIPSSLANYFWPLQIDNSTGNIYFPYFGIFDNESKESIVEFDGVTFTDYDPPFCMWPALDMEFDQHGYLWMATNYGLCDHSLYTFKSHGLGNLTGKVFWDL